ncbi:DUF2934 domain-containing protein [Archangium sp.]|uniref:DUF2934 domain-containing protein n=1 Tax=Archangium sp. TaxID=1872627 RepID=UPI00286D4470|nr:DUF2934 domain-containing protein [Archangium sp.]
MARTQSNKTSHTPSQQVPESSARNTATSNNRTSPTHEQIARRAYEIFCARGSTQGNPEEDWFQAERELKLGR